MTTATVGGLWIILMGVAVVWVTLSQISNASHNGLYFLKKWYPPSDPGVRKYKIGEMFPLALGVIWILLGAWVLFSPQSLAALLTLLSRDH